MTNKMNKVFRRLFTLLIIVWFSFMVFSYLVNNFEYNTTRSFPLGLYKKNSKDLERNDLVLFCPAYSKYMSFAEENGYWTGLKKKCGTTPQFLKKIIGLPYDNISITLDGVFVNDLKIKNSEPLKAILSDTIFINYEKDFQLQINEYFLMSDYNSKSYDSRYFGVVKRSEIKIVVEPFYNFK